MTSSRRYGLSKSKIAAYEQCPRRLWLQTHRPEAAVVDDGAEARFAVGNEVGDLARQLVADGVLVDDDDLVEALATTRRLLAEAPRPIFEATFQHDGVLVRVDVLSPDGAGAWHVAEVKSSSSAKDAHLRDLATQVWVMEATGLRIASAAIRHLDGDFVLRAAGRYDGLFADTDLTEAVRPIIADRPALVAAARVMLGGREPVCETGPQCHAPYECEFQAWCGRDAPEGPEWGIDLLPRTGARIAESWAPSGVFDLRDLPENAGLSPLHERIRRATVTGVPHVDRAAIHADTATWSYPRIWIDFETIAFAVPRWIGTSPWQQVPFQFSAHVEAADGAIVHVEALDLGGDDPRPLIAARLATLPRDGTPIAWNAGFEKRCFRQLAEACPEHADALYDLEQRTVDLLPVARNHYYHRDQRGSWSIKAVLPTLAPELDYAGLEVKDGTNAQDAYLEAIAPDCPPERRRAIETALLTYCGRDTWAMVEVLRRMLAPA